MSALRPFTPLNCRRDNASGKRRDVPMSDVKHVTIGGVRDALFKGATIACALHKIRA